MTGDHPPRKPKVFSADDPDIEVTAEPASNPESNEAGVSPGQDKRRPFGGDADDEVSSSDAADAPATPLPEAMVEAATKRWGLGSVLVTALISLFFLAAGLWFTRFISVALERNDWIGYAANGIAIVAAVIVSFFALREIIGLWRLSRLTGLRKDAETALRKDDIKAARAVSARLKRMSGRGRDKRWDLQRYRESERHMRSGKDLLGLADRVLLAPADKEARKIVYESARRVAVVTAVVPIAFVVVLFVLFENLRMTRRLAGAYGGRPGFLGGLRLFWWIITHLAATGAIALTDDLFGQFLGQDVARRVSRRLGEGAFNGAMTARLGVAAIGLTRPLPFIEASPPRIRSILVELFPELNPADLVSGVFRGKANKDRSERHPQ